MNLIEDPSSKLLLPRQFVDEKQALKAQIDKIVDQCVLDNQHIRETYYLTLHMKFDPIISDQFVISKPVITYRLPPFCSNQMVFWVNNSKGICEILWMVTRGKDKKLKVDFNTSGVAYLQAKGAMPKHKG